jgi:hypothetical protein
MVTALSNDRQSNLAILSLQSSNGMADQYGGRRLLPQTMLLMLGKPLEIA